MDRQAADTALGRRIRAVLFDVDGTLYRQAPLRLCMGLELVWLAATSTSFRTAREIGHSIVVFRRVREELRTLGEAPMALGTWQFVQTAQHTAQNPDELEQVVTEWMYRRPLKYLPLCRRAGIGELLSVLESAGIATGVLSDYPVIDKLQALGLANRFSLALCTTDPEINAFKPHPRGFLRACAAWGLSPEEVLYVGDRPETDAAGAAAAGMRCAILSHTGWLAHPTAPANGYMVVPHLAWLGSTIASCR